MSVNTTSGPLPEVRDAAESHSVSSIRHVARTSGDNPRLQDSADAASSTYRGGEEGLARSETATSSNKDPRTRWYQYLGRGMYQDIRNRLPFYVSDWTDAWNYRVVPATLVSYFAYFGKSA